VCRFITGLRLIVPRPPSTSLRGVMSPIATHVPTLLVLLDPPTWLRFFAKLWKCSSPAFDYPLLLECLVQFFETQFPLFLPPAKMMNDFWLDILKTFLEAYLVSPFFYCSLTTSLRSPRSDILFLKALFDQSWYPRFQRYSRSNVPILEG